MYVECTVRVTIVCAGKKAS